MVKQFLSPAIGNNSNWALCWQASTHGWAASTFHSRCDWKNHTIAIIKKGSYVFGGYTDIPWGKWVFIPGGWLVYERVGDTLWKIKIKSLEDTNLRGGGGGVGGGVRLYLTPKEGNQHQEPMKVSLLLSKGSPSLLLKYSQEEDLMSHHPKKCEYINHHVARYVQT